MKTPCNQCPFRKNDALTLGQVHRKNIVENAIKKNGFPCHKTVTWTRHGRELEKESPCVGAAIMILNNDGEPTEYLKSAEAKGKINLDEIYSFEPVFESFDEFIDAGYCPK